jgi:primosomal replication protein N
MFINRFIGSGIIGQWGCKLHYTEHARPQVSCLLVCKELGRDGAMFKTFIPVLIVGPQAEALAETLEPGDYVLIEGKLSFQAGKTKDSGKLVVIAFGVEVLHHTDAEASMNRV